MSQDYDDHQVKPFLKTHQLIPENQETPLAFLNEWITEPRLFFRRNHFVYPILDETIFFLRIDGIVKQPIVFHYQDIISMPHKTILLPLECAGNKRELFHPNVYGEQWQGGAISQAKWKGVPLKDLLHMAGIREEVKEVVFSGADVGPRTDMDGTLSYQRSLPLDKALHSDTLVAYEWNGRPIPYKHGFPLRLIVPQWYAMASVKWLNQIHLIDEPFKGPFQAVDYAYYPDKETDIGKKSVTNMRVNSIIQQPQNNEIWPEGTHMIYGLAWTGKGELSQVEVSTDHGNSWEKAELIRCQGSPYSWVSWSYKWRAAQKGEYTILVKATDTFGRTQPLEAVWNRKGYGYHAISKVNVKIE